MFAQTFIDFLEDLGGLVLFVVPRISFCCPRGLCRANKEWIFHAFRYRFGYLFVSIIQALIYNFSFPDLVVP